MERACVMCVVCYMWCVVCVSVCVCARVPVCVLGCACVAFCVLLLNQTHKTNAGQNTGS